MKSSRPPAAGIWLLERAGVDEGLAGDLAERFAARRCAIWYWRQAVIAIVMLWVHTILTHKWLAARAIATGWVMWATFWLLLDLLDDVPVATLWSAVAVTLLRYGSWVVIGWTVGMLHRPYQTPMVLAYVAFSLVMSVPAVGRMVIDVLGHPSYGPPSALMVVFVVISLFAGGLLSAASSGSVHSTNSQPRTTRFGG